MKLYQTKPEDDNMTRVGTTRQTFLGRQKADPDLVPNLSASTLMTFSRTSTSIVRIDTHGTAGTLTNTPGSTKSPTADTRGSFKEVSERVSLTMCSTT